MEHSDSPMKTAIICVGFQRKSYLNIIFIVNKSRSTSEMVPEKNQNDCHMQPSEFPKMNSSIFLLSSQQQKNAVSTLKDGNLESTTASYLLDVGDDLRSLVFWASKLLVNTKHQR